MNILLIPFFFFQMHINSHEFIFSFLFHDMVSWDMNVQPGNTILAQAPAPESSGASESPPIGGSDQNWGAMIVFAVGIMLFLLAYVFFVRGSKPTKKKKKKRF